MEYDEFIENKTKVKNRSEIIIDKSELNKILFEFQKDTIQKALKNGVYAIFHDCGLGKTYQQIWSNPNDLIFSPFGGIASEGYQAVIMCRRFHGIELKESYFQHGINNLIEAEKEKNQDSLFDVNQFAVK